MRVTQTERFDSGDPDQEPDRVGDARIRDRALNRDAAATHHPHPCDGQPRRSPRHTQERPCRTPITTPTSPAPTTVATPASPASPAMAAMAAI